MSIKRHVQHACFIGLRQIQGSGTTYTRFELRCIFILWVVCTEGPERIREPIIMGASFDHGEDVNLHLAREAGHSYRQIVRAANMRWSVNGMIKEKSKLNFSAGSSPLI
uniref:Uncharacterized protein n=1 Tax=Solanum lycopersicum TaxID=4081 RepID=A0A3Q7IER2_SOLLC